MTTELSFINFVIPYTPFTYSCCSKEEILNFINIRDFENFYNRKIKYSELREHSCFDKFNIISEGKNKCNFEEVCDINNNEFYVFVWCIKTSDKTIYIELLYDTEPQTLNSKLNRFQIFTPNFMYSNLLGCTPYRILDVIDDVQLW